MHTWKICLVFAAVAVQGCIGKGPSRQEAQSAAEAKIRKQASFDLQCDADKLKLEQMDSSENYGGAFFSYGVRGCEKQATFKAGCSGSAECTIQNESHSGK